MTARNTSGFSTHSGFEWGIDVLARATRQAVVRTVRMTTKKGNLSMAKTLRSRIAAVAVAALTIGLAQAVPASAAAKTDAPTYSTGSPVIVRADQSASSTTMVVAFGAALAAGDTVTFNTFTRNGVSLSVVPAGIASNTSSGNYTTPDTSTAGSIVLTADTGKIPSTANLVVDKTLAPGKYTFSAKVVGGTAATLTFYVSGAPTAIKFGSTSYSLDATATKAATFSVVDANSNPSYLVAGEAIDLAVSGGTATATLPTISSVFLDSNTYDNSLTSKSLTITTSSATTGTYTLTASRAAGLTSVANATTSIVVGAAPQNASGLALASRTYTNSDKAGSATDSDYDATDDGAVAAATTAGKAYLSTASKSLTFTASTAATSGNLRFTLATAGSGLAAGVAAGSTDVAIVKNASGTYEASFTVTSTAPAAGYGYTLSVESGANDYTFTVIYQTPVASKITTVDSLIAGGNIGAVKAGSTTVAVKVLDQFGIAFPSAGVTFTTSGRNAKNAGDVSGSDGTVSYTWTDASTSTVTAAPTDTFTAAIANTTDSAGYVEANSVQVTVNYANAMAADKVSVVANYDSTPTAGASAAYDAAISTAGTTKLTVRGDSTIGANGVTDQIVVKATVTDADGVAVPYARVTFAGSAGVYFANAASASLTSTETNVAVLASGKTTIDVYADANGVAYAQARFTKTGTGTVTAAALGKTSTAATVNVATAGAARSVAVAVSGQTATATVTDGFGNAVSGVTVTFTVSGGTFLTGANSVTGSTDSAGKATAALAPGTGLTLKAAISGAQEALLADDPVTGFVDGVASATVTATVAQPVDAAQAAADAAKAEAAKATAAVAALSVTISNIQTAISTLVASTTATLTLMSAQIRKIMKKLGIK